jgi:hypothetical protein
VARLSVAPTVLQLDAEGAGAAGGEAGVLDDDSRRLGKVPKLRN